MCAESIESPTRKPPVQAALKLDAVRDLIDGVLCENLPAQKKERRAADPGLEPAR